MRGVGQDVAHRDCRALRASINALRRTARHVEPDRLARRRQRRVAERHPQRFADDLRRRRRAENWQPPPGEAQARQPRSAASSQRDLAVGEAHADRLHLAGVLALVGSSVTPPGTSTHGRSWLRGERHHHRRQTLVAGRDAEHAAPRRQRADQAPENDRGVVADRAGCRTSPVVPCERPSHGSVHAAANGIAPAGLNSRAAASISSPTSQWPV